MKEICRMECERILRNIEIEVGKDGLLERFLVTKVFNIDPQKKKPFIIKWIKKTEKEVDMLKKKLVVKVENKDKDNKCFIKKLNTLKREIKCAKKYVESCDLLELKFNEKIAVIRNCKKEFVRAYILDKLTNKKISRKSIIMKKSTILDSSFLLNALYHFYEES